MTSQQQEPDNYNPPKSPIPNPIPPIRGKVIEKFCDYCHKHITIQKERISDDDKGRPRFRRVPRNADNDEIHSCHSLAKRVKFNETKKEHG
jgi:hypothetical protein